jgi:hypothetical protein
MVSTLELTVVMSTDTVDLVCFLFFFLASAVLVAAIVAAAREADIFPDDCHVHHGVVTLEGALRDVVGAPSSLRTVESEMYSSTGGPGAACASAVSRTL